MNLENASTSLICVLFLICAPFGQVNSLFSEEDVKKATIDPEDTEDMVSRMSVHMISCHRLMLKFEASMNRLPHLNSFCWVQHSNNDKTLQPALHIHN